jgi:hypothetical protein
MREQIIPRDYEFECQLRMQFLVARRCVLDRHDDRLKLFFRFLELLVRFYDLLGCRDLLLRLPGLVECHQQLIGVRHSFAADLNGVRLFCRNENPPLV